MLAAREKVGRMRERDFCHGLLASGDERARDLLGRSPADDRPGPGPTAAGGGRSACAAARSHALQHLRRRQADPAGAGGADRRDPRRPAPGAACRGAVGSCRRWSTIWRPATTDRPKNPSPRLLSDRFHAPRPAALPTGPRPQPQEGAPRRDGGHRPGRRPADRQARHADAGRRGSRAAGARGALRLPRRPQAGACPGPPPSRTCGLRLSGRGRLIRSSRPRPCRSTETAPPVPSNRGDWRVRRHFPTSRRGL